MEFGKIGIGTKESVTLKPATVKIVSYKVEMQKKDEKEIGNKVSVTCKHPDKDEFIEISSVSYRKGKEIKTSGLWFKLDSDGMIPKLSALASFINHLNVSNLDQIVGKDVVTELDDKNYLCFKAY
jgi:hypothetical protein